MRAIKKLISKVKKIIKKRKLISRNIRNLEEIIEYSIKSNDLENAARTSDERMTTDKKCLDTDLIVSLTSFSRKVHEVHLVLESISQQTVKPNRIILWLDENEFSDNNLPLILHRQIERGLEVKYCPNYYSYKKIIPSLEIAPNSYIVTIDDDVIYDSNCIEILVNETKAYPNTIIGHRGHKINLNSAGDIAPYKQWGYDTRNGTLSHLVCLTGCGSIIYPPKTLHEDVTDIETALKLSPKADDLWLKINALRNNTLCKITDYSCRMTGLKRNRDIGLAHGNVRLNGNDKQMKTLIKSYPDALKKLQTN